MKSNFIWDNTMVHPLCASLYTERDKEVDVDNIRYAKDLIKKHTGLFSNFRGSVQLVYATMLSLAENPEIKLEKALKAYNSLKNEFWSTQYLPISAFVIADLADPVDYAAISKRAKDLFRVMKQEHPFLTSGEDVTFAVMIALSGLRIDLAINEMERCYQVLKGDFFSKNSVQSISHVLTLSDENTADKCRRVVDIFNGLRSRGYKFGTGNELAILGVLSLGSKDINKVINDIIRVDDFLQSKKRFGIFGIGRPQRMMYAAILVMQEYNKEIGNESDRVMNMTSINSVTGVIIAQQIAMSAAIAASAASASNNN